MARRSSSTPKLSVSRRSLNCFCSHLMKPWDLLIASWIVFAVCCKKKRKNRPKQQKDGETWLKGSIRCSHHTYSSSDVSEWIISPHLHDAGFSGGKIHSNINYTDCINSSLDQHTMIAVTIYKKNLLNLFVWLIRSVLPNLQVIFVLFITLWPVEDESI